MKRLKTVLILGLIILAAAAALALAAEPAQPVLPLRARVLEILQQHPEVWEEIQALEEDYGPPAADDETDSSSGLWGPYDGQGAYAPASRQVLPAGKRKCTFAPHGNKAASLIVFGMPPPLRRYFFYSRQKLGVTSTSKVKSSRRPNSMSRENKSLAEGPKLAKVRLGPTRPKPGPILPKVAATALMELSRSAPVREIKREATAKVERYKK